MRRLICCVVIAELVSCGATSAQEWLYLAGGAELTITDSSSMHEYSGITLCSGSSFDYGNHLAIGNGAYVRCLGSMNVNGTVSTGSNYSWLYSYASITGEGSVLDIDGNLELWSPDLPERTPGTWDPWGVPCSMQISGGAEVSVAGNVSISNRSTLELGSAGKLSIGADFNASMTGFSTQPGSTLTVAGQLSGLSLLESGRRIEAVDVLGDLLAHGTYAPGNSPADSMLDGSLTIASDGTLEMELGGHVLGDEYDRLTVTQMANLDGELDVVLLDQFTLSFGDHFDLFNWDGEVVGEFASISTNALSGDLAWDTSELYTTGTLSVIPEPTSATLMLFIGAGWVIRRRLKR